MLNVYYGHPEKSDFYDRYVHNPDVYFDNTYEEEWFEEEFVKEMVKAIDNTEVVSGFLAISPVLGSIPITKLSGGVKALILMLKDDSKVFNASACGDNCAPWILKIGEIKDLTIRLGYHMEWGKQPYEFRILNSGKVVHDWESQFWEAVDWLHAGGGYSER